MGEFWGVSIPADSFQDLFQCLDSELGQPFSILVRGAPSNSPSPLPSVIQRLWTAKYSLSSGLANNQCDH